MKKLVQSITVYRTLGSNGKNWFSIRTCDGLNTNNILINGRKALLKTAFALIAVAIFKRNVVRIRRFRNNKI